MIFMILRPESLSPKSEKNPSTLNSKKLETGLRTNSAGIPYTLLLRIQAVGFPIVGLVP